MRRQAASDGYRTAVAVASNTERGYPPFLETINNFAHARQSMFGGVSGEPRVEVVIGSLECSSYEEE